MIVKVNKVQEDKLEFIAKHGKVKLEDMLPKVIDGFIQRFEDKHGIIDLSARKKRDPKKPNLVFRMYEHYKEFYQQALGKEYTIEKKKKVVDMRHIKTVRNKIVNSIAQELKQESLSVDDENVLAAFKFFLSKTPDWWIQNSFAPSSLATNFEKIMNQIKNPKDGRRSTKNALDDYLVELTANGNTGI